MGQEHDERESGEQADGGSAGNGESLGPARMGPARLGPVSSALKLSFDTVAAAFLLVVLAPVFLGCMLVIKLSGGGPTIESSPRVGRRGNRFELLSFRIPAGHGLGRVMHQYGIDHLPELVNVLRGEMSMVGPRPSSTAVLRVAGTVPVADLRPGITGLWVLHPRADITEQHTASLDRHYVGSWSLAGDIRILTRTAATVRYRPETT